MTTNNNNDTIIIHDDCDIIAISWLLHPLSVPMIASDYMTAWSTTIAWTARMKSNDNDNSIDDHETNRGHNHQ